MSDRYVLTQANRARPYAIGAVLDLVAAGLVVIGIGQGSRPLIVIGIVGFVLGLAISVAAVVARQKLRTVVDLHDAGLSIRSGGQQADATWSDISGVSADQRAIYLERHGDRPALKINSPRGAGDPQLVALSTELTQRLDDHRGYHPLE